MYKFSFKILIVSFITSLISLSTGYSKDISMNFIANASVRITDGEYILFTDFPYVSGAYGQMTYQYPFFVEQDNNVTTLITNRLNDHFDPNAFMNLGWKIIAPAEVVSDVQKRYFELNQARENIVAELEREREINQALRPNDEIVVDLPPAIIEPDTVITKEHITNGPMEITSFSTKAGETEHYSYLLEWAGKKIYFSGETGDISHLAALPSLDVAFLSPWLFENARKENALPNTKKIVIYQHKENEIIPNCFDCIIPQKGEFIPID